MTGTARKRATRSSEKNWQLGVRSSNPPHGLNRKDVGRNSEGHVRGRRTGCKKFVCRITAETRRTRRRKTGSFRGIQ